MSRISSHFLASTLAICIGTGIAAAQSTSSTDTASNTAAASTPAAYVYVSSQPTTGTEHIYGYAAAQDGKLTPVPGSPLTSSLVGPLALNGKWLFGSVNLGGSDETGQYAIDSYRIAANGSLQHADTYSGTAPYSEEPQNLFLDHTGASLYTGLAISDYTSGYGSFSIDQTNGKITPVNYVGANIGVGALTFIGNNRFAYSVTCFRGPDILGYQRKTDGALSELQLPQTGPAPPPDDFLYCPLAAAADPTNHVVMSLEPQATTGPNLDPSQLAVYTADEDGNLSTTSTYENMPTTQAEPDQLAMSTGGAFLAAAGSATNNAPGNGLQVFRMHGADPLTVFSGVLIPDIYAQGLFWDKYDHLYLLGTSKLYVFSVTESGVKQAPGSPYSIPSPSGLIVLPK